MGTCGLTADSNLVGCRSRGQTDRDRVNLLLQEEKCCKCEKQAFGAWNHGNILLK